ncbi:ScbR family autoregulator-binding transcription factor [Streptomyces lavendulae]|uniref:ScbR family autoregulator-binding transcription factor n=1 Tax=Streptomyces TaxID=1883 RepID=UPI0024743525|nr:ScbR family autoregulator-binding transcription factor [Streptomyces sp. SPB4]MDH6542306.1 AcrR family transcriptional regulator [Streptomyces sp. SPB4]
MIKQERAVRTRRALIESAARVFGRRGYAEATLSMISVGAGVSPGALHFHFENKAAIAAAVEAAAARALRSAAREVYARRTSALQALADSSHALAGLLLSDTVARAGFQLSREPTYPSSYALPGEWHEYVHRLLAEAAHEDALLPGLNRQSVATTVVAATLGFEVLGRDDPQWLAPRTLAGFWRVVMPCLAAPATLRSLGAAGRGS